MQFTQILTLLAATTIKSASAQGGSSGGGWYVKGDTLQCSGTCQPPSCVMLGPPSDDEIRSFCTQIYNDCADGVLDSHHSQNFAGYALIGTANFGTGPAHGNNGCPNNDDCFQSFRWLSLAMVYPSSEGSMDPYCQGANVQIYGHYNHQQTGSIVMAKARYFWEGPGPGRRSANVTFTA